MSVSVELEGPAEREKLHALLNSSFAEYCTTLEDAELQTRLEGQMASVASLLDAWVPIRGRSSLHGLQGPAGPSMPRLAPPPRDAEVTELEQELERAAKKITELRGSMHAQLVSELSARLAAQRPELAAAEPEGFAADRDEPSALPGPALEGLAEKLAAASDSCPALRAQLEETLARLNRILGAVRSEAERAQQAGERGPATVERVLLARPGDDPTDNRGEAGAEQPGASVRRLLIDSLT